MAAIRIPQALEEKIKSLSDEPYSNVILALADLKADELIKENKNHRFRKIIDKGNTSSVVIN